MDRVALGEGDGTLLVHGLAGDVEDAAEDALADGHGNRGAGVERGHAAHEALGRGHGDGADQAAAEMLLHLEGELFGLAGDGEVHRERLIDGRDEVLGELHVDDGADDLDDFTVVHKGLNI